MGENDNRCAGCGARLAARKLMSYYYDESTGAFAISRGTGHIRIAVQTHRRWSHDRAEQTETNQQETLG